MPYVKYSDDDIHNTMTLALKSTKLGKEDLAGAIDFVKKANNKGIRPVRIFPIGIINPDGVGVEVHADEADLGELLELLKIPGIRGVKLFPKGIIRPDLFVGELELDARQ
jgi:hypothetical protein